MSIQFDTIPLLLRPGNRVEFNNRNAVGGIVGQPHRILVIGPRLTTGSVAALVPTQVGSVADARTYFKAGSPLADMLADVLDINKVASVTAIAQDDDGAAVKATGTLTYTGPATAAGTLCLYIAGKRIRVGVNSGDTATVVATAVAAAINGMGAVNLDDMLPVTATSALGVVTVTARNANELGNSINMRHNATMGEFFPKGIACAIVAMNGGTANPHVADVIDAIGSAQYNTIIMPYTDAANLTAMAAELVTRWNGLHTNDGMCFSAIAGGFSTLTTFGATRNDAFITILATDATMTPPWRVAADYGAQRATQTAPNQLGRPLQTLTLDHTIAPAEQDRFTDDEREQLLAKGLATYFVDDGGICRIERAVTTYKTNSGGSPDPSYRDVEKISILSYLRFDLRAMVSQTWPRSMLMDDDDPIPPGLDVVTPAAFKNMCFGRFKLWMAQGLVQDEALFQSQFKAEINGSDSDELDAIIPPKCIGQFRKFSGRMDFRV